MPPFSHINFVNAEDFEKGKLKFREKKKGVRGKSLRLHSFDHPKRSTGYKSAKYY
jgi:hypothetical protein